MANPPDEARLTINAQELWSRYEDITMHFNDLLMRLRSQSVAGIAAISTLVGLFSKEGLADIRMSWLAAAAIFLAMALFWVAIWCLDFFYYNRLLSGAVAALTALEGQIKSGTVENIQMSTTIEAEFRKPVSTSSYGGVLSFYAIVLIAIVAGAILSATMYSRSVSAQPSPAASHPASSPAALASAGRKPR